MTGNREQTLRPNLQADRKATIGDVAALAGVSVGTVSNVINGRAKVSAKRKEKVEAAIKTLSFSGSLLAKGMRSQRYPVVGLCVPNMTSSNFVHMSDALEAHATAAGFELVHVITRHDPAREEARVERLIASRASGVLILPTRRGDIPLAKLAASAMPTVIINRFVESEMGADQVLVDHRSAFRRAALNLIDWGYDRLIVATQFPNFAVVQQNIAGMRDAIAESKRPVVLEIMKCGRTPEEFRDLLADALPKADPHCALVASGSLLAARAIESMRTLGLRYPDDVGLLCAEEPDWAQALWPTLSCVQQPTRELAQIAWDLLARRMSGEGEAPITIRCDARINFRGSVKSS
ncbi:LacI family DNA-binding transcriptional regulator [Mesorhizobium sp.]|uniref:LacI family DNA-binding transcriptional regulator n=1 Tax=Mesorhizobium sp. TaxID=1871066 RepID=UPI0025C493F5|nr:LacI family DNA-binding transcriptional regulator [Mesorhizobium sp.]